MRLMVIIDNKIAVAGFAAAWGFSCLVGKDLLFDTGESTALLFRNLAQAGVRPENLKIVTVSHGDEDHTGGLIGLLEQNPSIQVVLHTNFPQDLITHLQRCNTRLMFVDRLTELSPDIFVTGPYPTREQALVIQSKTGLVVLTGCAHPDPVKILENIRNKMIGEIDLVIGGFHLVDQTKSETLKTIKEFRRLGVNRVGPCHCTGEKAIRLFMDEYGYDFLEVGAGFSLEV